MATRLGNILSNWYRIRRSMWRNVDLVACAVAFGMVIFGSQPIKNTGAAILVFQFGRIVGFQEGWDWAATRGPRLVADDVDVEAIRRKHLP